MANDPRVLELVEEMFYAGKTPDEVCRDCPELLAEVREKWKEFHLPCLPTKPDVGALTPGNSAGNLPQVPGYKVSAEVGRGGMGIVYRARDLSLDRDVAVKLLQDGYPADSPIARRFTDEARITAQLQHPGVPAVYRVGALADGRPFLAMKLIKGCTLAALLEERPDPAVDRGRFVAIFEHVCHSVAYAHSLRVIHRDLKPANVMVGKFGEAQVMDWGLAKVLTARDQAGSSSAAALDTAAATAIRTARDADQETQAGSLLGTPAFMPPEQAIGAVDQMDVRSDIFSLGGILCAVLTGQPPYVADTAEATRQLAAWARLEDAHARLAACGAEPELAALCRRCLAPEPDDRPRNAGEVAAAVAALRTAAEERARCAELDRVRAAEQNKRRQVLLAASGVVALVLVAGLGVSLWQMFRAIDAEGRAKSNEAAANEERDLKAKALDAETKARQQAFTALRSMTADVIERKLTQGGALTDDDKAFLHGVIAQFDAFAAIKGDDAESRAARAEGRFRVGSMRARLGELKDAERDYQQAVAVQSQLLADFPVRAEYRQDLAKTLTARGILLHSTGRLKDAEQDYDRALSIHKQLAVDFPSRPEFRRGLAISFNNRGTVLYAAGRILEAERDHDQAIEIQSQLAAEFPSRPEFRDELATDHSNRGALLSELGRLKDAVKDFDQALSIRRQLKADFPSRPEFRDGLAVSHHNRGRLLIMMGRLQESEKDYDQALSIYKQLAADFPSQPEFRQNLARSYIGRGGLLIRTGRHQEAEQDYDRAVSLLKHLLADFPSRLEIRQHLAMSHHDRADLLSEMGRHPEAELDYDQVLNINRKLVTDFPNLPDLQNELAATCANLAPLHQRQGNWAAAKRLLLEGRPHHLAALKANPRHPLYRQEYRNHLMLLTSAHAGLLERPDAVRTAETCRDLGWNAAADAYNAACYMSLCVPIVAKHDKLDARQREEAVQFYGDAAMKLLRDAARKGYQDAAHMKKDTDLDPLRQRDDFQKLVAELEETGK